MSTAVGAVVVSAADTSMALEASLGPAAFSGTRVETMAGAALYGTLDSQPGVKIGELIDSFDFGRALWGTLSSSDAGLTATADVGITVVVGVALLGSSKPILFLT